MGLAVRFVSIKVDMGHFWQTPHPAPASPAIPSSSGLRHVKGLPRAQVFPELESYCCVTAASFVI
jgi:hypothetical protein